MKSKAIVDSNAAAAGQQMGGRIPDLELEADILEALPFGLLLFKFEHPDRFLLLDANPAAEHMTGISRDKCRYKELDKIWPQPDGRLINEICLKARKAGRTAVSEKLSRNDEDGKDKMLMVRPRSISAGRILMIVDDISGGEMAAKELRDVKERLDIQTWGMKKTNEGITVLYNELQRKTRDLERSFKRLKLISVKDPHTGLYNHRYLSEVLEAEFYRARRYAQPLSMIMVDIDYFKSINDVYGHEFGDDVLRQFAFLLKRVMRRYDIIIRFGGEEFIILSPGIEGSKAIVLGRRIQDIVTMYNFGDKEHVVKLTISAGVVSYPDDMVAKSTDFIEYAERILSRIKGLGGNRVLSMADIREREGAVEISGKESEDVAVLKDRLEKLNRRSNQSVAESIFAFAKTIELKDHYTGEHVEKSVYYATEIAKALGMGDDEVSVIRRAAMLHDLGKIGISEKILRKRSKLTKNEFVKIKNHPQIGADILRPINVMHDIIPLILHHHERWDGKGYPSGLKGEEIPVGARIIAVADVYQALTSDRSYRKAFTRDKAIKIIKSDTGTKFDPHVVDVFLKVLEKEG